MADYQVIKHGQIQLTAFEVAAPINILTNRMIPRWYQL
jgi:hypothetical protein